MRNKPLKNNAVFIGNLSVPLTAALLVMAAGVIVLIEWTFGVKLLANFSPLNITFKANTAVAFLAAGSSLLLWQLKDHRAHLTAQILSVFVFLIGTATLSQYVFDFNLGIDELLFREAPGAAITSHPGRMSPLVALNFILTATALFIYNHRTRKGVSLSECFALTALIIPIITALGYLFGATSLYSFKNVTGVALIAAIVFLVLCVGILAVRNERGLISVFLSKTRGGSLLRVLLPTSLMALLVLDWLAVYGARAGWYEETLTVPLALIASGLVIAALIFLSARLLHDADLAREIADARLAAEHAVTRSIAAGKNFAETEDEILEGMCKTLDVDYCALWLPDETGEKLYCSNSKTVRKPEIKEFEKISRGLRFGKSEGFPGKIWENAEAIWIENVPSNVISRDDAAADADLKTAFGFPIKHESEVLGVVEFFTTRHIERNQLLVNMLDAMGSEIGQFMVRKRLEEEREHLLEETQRARQEAEEANRLKDEFLSVVSHELRTPLNSMLGWVEIYKKQPNAEIMNKAADVIQRQGKQQLRIIEDLLDTSRIISGNMRLEMQTIRFDEVIENALESVRPAANAKNIELVAETPYLSEVTLGDPNRLQQVVWNLLSNAVKFTPADGKVKIKLQHDGSQILITVSDTGEGISPEFLPFVFDRFRQADNSVSRRHGGLGLGLALVRHIVELHGGRVSATSEGKGEGSTFTVYLPSQSGNGSNGAQSQ